MDKGIPKRKCFVALFDILGFKNLLKKSDLKRVFDTYVSLKSEINENVGHLNTLLRKPVSLEKDSVEVINYSDTFILYTLDITSQGQETIDKAFEALLVACDFMFLAANESELPIRGAFAVGELIISDGILIGEPIVEAYENEQKQEWIGCWITQECIDLISEKTLKVHLGDRSIVKYSIPFKDGNVKKMYAFNWARSRPFQNGKIRFLQKKYSHKWPAERKYRNTKEFIDYISSLS